MAETDAELARWVLFFILVAFLPSVLWIAWLVKRARDSPGFFALAAMFIWGAVFAVIVAVILSILAPEFSPWKVGTPMFFMAVIVAPIAEEFAKPLGLRVVRDEVGRIRDGIILGATAGLGFAATENLLYGQAALAGGDWTAFWATAVLRGIAACALHAAATGMTGRGYAMAITEGRSFAIVIPFYMIAVVMHGLYNYMAIQGTLLGLLGAVLLALAAMAHTGNSLR